MVLSNTKRFRQTGATVLVALALLTGFIVLVQGDASATPAQDFSAISAGSTFTCGVTTAAGAKCWGNDAHGALGNGLNQCTDCFVPGDVVGLTSGVAAVSAGDLFACALTTSGAVKCWGRNEYGQLGDGSTSDRESPVDVAGLSSGVTSIAAGLHHACAVDNGQVKCWGRNWSGELGHDTLEICNGAPCSTTPVVVDGLSSGQLSVTAGGKILGALSCSLTGTGATYCWGSDEWGQLGSGHACQFTCSIPVSVAPPASSGVTSVSAGGEHVCAAKADLTLLCWGWPWHALGIGDSWDSIAVPNVVSAGSVASVTAGSDHTCAITVTGVMRCWGDNTNGQLGAATPGWSYSSTPIDVAGLSLPVTAADAGGWHTCALMQDASAKCWGSNQYGQLGDGTNTDRPLPVDVVTTIKPGSDTATPTSAATPTSQPASADFSLAASFSENTGGPCNSSSVASETCYVPQGKTFRINLNLNSLPSGLPPQGYAGYDSIFRYTGVAYSGQSSSVNHAVWPDCFFDAYANLPPNNFGTGCVTYFDVDSTHIGRMHTVEFSCQQDGLVSIGHGYGYTVLLAFDGEILQFIEQPGSVESLRIDCVPPGAYPADTDGDGCPDMKEQGGTVLVGGSRNFLNPFDYFNPSHDGQNRVDDILLTVQAYFRDDSDSNPGLPPYAPGYAPDTDRTYLGPLAWNLGPPNGLQRVDDILNQVKQYFHDCS